MPHHLLKRPGSGNWWLDIKVKGRQRIRRSSGTPERKTAEAIAERIEAAEWGRLIHGDSASLTFAEAVLMYVDDGKSGLFTAPLVKHFRNARVMDIGPEDIRGAGRILYPDAKPATWNRQVVVPARAIINHAAGKRLAAYIKVKNFPEMRPVRKAPSGDWLPALLASAATPKRIAALALLMRVTAARIGQALRMEWSAVDLSRGVVVVPHAKGYPERQARLTAEAVALLANLDGERQGRVFGWEGRSAVYKPWKAACKAAGIAYVTPHPAGRYGFATAMRAKGIDPKTAASRGGWKSVRLMLDIYAGEDENPDLIEDVFGTFESQPTCKENLHVRNQKAKSKT